MVYTSLVERSLDLAAGTRVDLAAYEKWAINLAKLQSLGRCYRQGWLHNVLRRITPHTARNTEDYLMMADLFIANHAEARMMLTRMSQDLSMFATAAGVHPASAATSVELAPHLSLYTQLCNLLTQKFAVQAPAPFGSTVFDAEAQAQMPFVRAFLKQRSAA